MIARIRPPPPKPKGIDIVRALKDKNLLGAALGDPSTWTNWFTILRAANGLPLNSAELAFFQSISGGRNPPTSPVRELWIAAGRGSGKSRIAGANAAFIATCINHRRKLSPGEVGTILTLSASKPQADAVHNFAEAFINLSPLLSQRVIDTTADQIRLFNNITIATHTNSFRTIRGRTLLACVFDEVAFWRDDSSANPDVEVYTAVLPMLARTGGQLIAISSPYRKVGLLAAKHRDYFGQDDPHVLVVQAATTLLNPTIDLAAIEKARQADPLGATSEWDAEFRSDLQQFLSDDLIDSAVDYSRPLELPPRQEHRYVAFVDMSAGRHDASTIAILHTEGTTNEPRYVVDVIRGHKAPHDPSIVANEFAKLAQVYHCAKIVGDAFAGEWVSGTFRNAGIHYVTSELPRSQLYLEGLPLWSRGQVSIPNHPQLLRELRLLERSTHRSGKDSVDHPKNGTDDYANSLFGALWCRAGARQPMKISQAVLDRARLPPHLDRSFQNPNSTGFTDMRMLLQSGGR